MKIGELASRSGLSASRIRFYESNGLLLKAGRQANGYRDYPEEALMVLEIIASAQQAGFSLEEIRSLMPSDSASWEHEKLIEALEQKIADIAAMEQRLAGNRAQLLALVEAIRNRPEGLTCADQAQQLLGSMRQQTFALAQAAASASEAPSQRRMPAKKAVRSAKPSSGST